GRPDGVERQAAGPRRAHRDGMLRGGPERGAARDRSRGRQREARHRHGREARGQARGRAPACGGRRVRAAGRGRPAAGQGVTARLAVGLMSGTSLDGVSTALVRLTDDPSLPDAQLGAPAVIAERVGVPVVSDFRARDVAAGGQGAPLVPLADVMLFGHPERGRLLLNVGGMANVTWAPRRGVIAGALAFDTGPGVAVIDAVTRRLDPTAPFDLDGERARRGRPVLRVLDALLADPYFAQPPPKSTGRERFGLDYANRLIELVTAAGGSDNDAVATATALTV